MSKITKRAFYVLSHTWGLPMTLIGYIVEGVLSLSSYRITKYGYCHLIVIGHNWGGCTLGKTILCSEETEHVLNHEHGHAIQNCYFGILMPFLVCIPSAARYWWRNYMKHIGKGDTLVPYDAIWFEGQATRVGTEFMNNFN